MNRRIGTIVCLTALSCIQGIRAQYYDLSTNIVAWTTGTFNLEASLSVGRRVTIHLPLLYNPFVFGGGRRMQQLSVLPGLRYWWDGLQRGGFVGVHLLASRYHAGKLWDQFRYDGLAAGAGFTLGYAYSLSDRWRFEWELGASLLWADYNKYRCKPCGAFLGHYRGYRFVPTRAAANLVYQF